MLTLTSELALLLVAIGDSETLIVRLRVGPDLTLYMEDAGIFVINGRKLPGMVRLISCANRTHIQKKGTCKDVFGIVEGKEGKRSEKF